MKAKPGQTDWTKTNSFPMTPIAPSPAPVPFPEETQNVQPTMAKQQDMMIVPDSTNDSQKPMVQDDGGIE